MSHHIILNRSCLNIKYIPDGIVALTITSPPYGQIKNYSDDNEQIGNYSGDMAIEKLVQVFKECYRITKDGGFLCLNIPNYVEGNLSGQLFPCVQKLTMELINMGWKLYREIYWKKNGTYAKYGKHPYHFFVDVEPIIVFRKIEKAITGDAGGKLSDETREFDKTSVWEMNPVSEKDKHIATFPMMLSDRCIKCYSQKNDIIYDPFLGSGTVTLSAKNLDRHSIGVELKEDYIKVIKEKIGMRQGSLFGEENKFWIVKKDDDIICDDIDNFLKKGVIVLTTNELENSSDFRPKEEALLKSESSSSVDKESVSFKGKKFTECKVCGLKSPPAKLNEKGLCEFCE